jgi:predicted RNA-binding protein YlxR (DUF448 family)
VRRKHKPQRMCVACRKSQDKKSLVRIVRTPEGIYIDETGKLAGRGAYLHADPSCWEQGLKKFLEKALNTEFSDADRERLSQFQASLADQSGQETKASGSTQ